MRKRPVHQLVLAAYSGPKPFDGAVTRHLNGVANDNRAENLAWGTTQENAADSVRHGTAVGLRRGDRHPRTVISSASVNDIRRSNLSSVDLAMRYGVTAAWIDRIRVGKVRRTG